MSKRLVDANELKETIVDALDALKEILGEHNKSTIDAVIHTVCNAVDRAETVDPVKHGEWVDTTKIRWVNKTNVPVVMCTECGIQFCDLINNHYYMYHYCPNCGAKMGSD